MKPNRSIASLLLCFIAFYLQAQIIINIEAQTERADSLLVINQSGLVRGDSLTQDALANGIRRVYDLGLFREVSVETTRIADGVKVLFRVKEFNSLKRIEFSGNRRVKTKELKEKVALKEGEVLTDKKIFDGKTKIALLYKEKGFVLAKVEAKTSPPDTDNRTVLTYEIDEGDRVRIKKIEILENTAFPDKAIKRRMKNKEKVWYRKGYFNEEEFKKDLERITDFYKEQGYLDCRIEDYELLHKDAWLIINIKVFEGQRYYFGNITFEGDSLISEERLVRALRIRTAKPYNIKKATQTLAELSALYAEEGYIYATVIPVEEARADTVDIRYKIIEGSPAQIRLVHIIGNERTSEKVIRREISSLPGTLFKRSEVIRSQRDIFNLGFFEDVTIDYKTINDLGDIDLSYKVKEKQSFGTIGAGISYSAQDKLTGYVELSQPNLFGRGQRAYIKLEKGGRKTNAEFGFTEPWLFDQPISLGFDFSYLTRSYDYYDKQEIGGGINLSRSLPLDYSRGYLSLRLSDAYVPKNSIREGYPQTGPYNIYRDTVHRTAFAPSFRFLRDSRDYIFNPISGSYFNYEPEVSFGDIRFQRHIIESRIYYPIFQKFSLMFKSRLGLISPLSKRDTVPIYERFYPGGTGEDGLRGYPDRSLGVKEGVYNIGGRSLAIFSLEYKFRLSHQVAFISFIDAGNTWESFSDFNLGDLKRGAGIGVRLEIPMLGLLGFDFGYGFDREGGGRWEPHFLMGRPF